MTWFLYVEMYNVDPPALSIGPLRWNWFPYLNGWNMVASSKHVTPTKLPTNIHWCQAISREPKHVGLLGKEYINQCKQLISDVLKIIKWVRPKYVCLRPVTRVYLWTYQTIQTPGPESLWWSSQTGSDDHLALVGGWATCPRAPSCGFGTSQKYI